MDCRRANSRAYKPAAFRMPSTYCFVNGCPHALKNTAGISYHLVPNRANRKKQWEEAVGHSLTHCARVCSAHFRALDYMPSTGDRKRRRLKISAVPSIFKLSRKRKRRRRREAVSPKAPLFFRESGDSQRALVSPVFERTVGSFALFEFHWRV